MSILPTGCRAADPAAGRRPPTGSPADARRTARRSSAGAIWCGRRHRCDKTCNPKTEDPTLHHLPAVQLDDDLLPRSPLPFRLVHDGPACATPGGDSASDAPIMARSTDRLSDGTEV